MDRFRRAAGVFIGEPADESISMKNSKIPRYLKFLQVGDTDAAAVRGRFECHSCCYPWFKTNCLQIFFLPPLWSRTTKNPDVNTREFAHSFTCTTHSFACSALLTLLICFLACSLIHFQTSRIEVFVHTMNTWILRSFNPWWPEIGHEFGFSE